MMLTTDEKVGESRCPGSLKAHSDRLLVNQLFSLAQFGGILRERSGFRERDFQDACHIIVVAHEGGRPDRRVRLEGLELEQR